MNRSVIVLWGTMLVFSPFAKSGEMGTYTIGANLSQCGINALYVSLRHLGMHVSLDNLYDRIEPDISNQVNLWQLAQFAREKGLYVKGIKHPTVASLKKMLNSESSIILQYRVTKGEFSRAHIVTLVKSKSGDTMILDIPVFKQVVNDEQVGILLKESQGLIVLSLKPFHESRLVKICASEKTWIFFALLSAIIMTLAAIILIGRRHREQRSLADSFEN
jgi:hypothetical protein